MTPNEFQIVKRRIWDTFPDLCVWATSLNAGQKAATSRRWEQSLVRLNAEDVHITIDALAIDDASPWPEYGDKERAGAILAKLTGDRIAKAKESRESPNDALPPRPANYQGAGIMGRVLNAIATDARHVKGCAEFRAEFGRCVKGCPVPALIGSELSREDAGLEADAQRFNCPLCRDTGFVSCLAAADIVTTIRTGQVPRVRETYSMACGCSVGQRLGQQGQREGKRPVEPYDASRDVLALASDAEIVTTCQEMRETWGGRRNAAFDAFNQQEFI